MPDEAKALVVVSLSLPVSTRDLLMRIQNTTGNDIVSFLELVVTEAASDYAQLQGWMDEPVSAVAASEAETTLRSLAAMPMDRDAPYTDREELEARARRNIDERPRRR